MPPVWYCCSVAVDPQTQGRGIGSRLLAAALSRVRRLSAAEVPIVIAARTQNNLVVRMFSSAVAATRNGTATTPDVCILPLAAPERVAAQQPDQLRAIQAALDQMVAAQAGSDGIIPRLTAPHFDRQRMVFPQCYPPHLIPVFRGSVARGGGGSGAKALPASIPHHALLEAVMQPEAGDAALLLFVL